MSYFSVKDFTTNLAAKVRSVLVNTDENLPAHILQDSAGNEVLGTRTDAANNFTNTTSISAMSIWKSISATLQGQANSSQSQPVKLQDGAGNALTSDLRGGKQTLAVEIIDGTGNQITTFGGSGGTASTFGSTFPTQGTAMGAKNGTNMVNLTADSSNNLNVAVAAGLPTGANTVGAVNLKINGNNPDLAAGTGGSATMRVAIDTSQIGSPGPQSSANSTSVTPANSSDVTPSRVNTGSGTNATNLKGAAGVVRSIDLFNTSANTVYFKFYNKATAPTVGTDTPIWTIPLPAGGGYSKQYFIGTPFSTGISYAITTGQADANTTGVNSGDVTGQINWV